MKFGYEFRRTTIMQVIENTFRGKLSFNEISDPDNEGVKISPLEAFLRGLPDGEASVVATRAATHTKIAMAFTFRILSAGPLA